MTQVRLRRSRWTALLGALVLACAVLLFQVAHVTAAPMPVADAAAMAMPCHGEAAASSKTKHEHADQRSCAMHCTALFLPSIESQTPAIVPVPPEGGRIAFLSSREPPTPERPPKR